MPSDRSATTPVYSESFRCSRQSLLAGPLDLPDALRDRVRRVVSNTTTTHIIKVRDGSLHRVDLWATDSGMVLHGWQPEAGLQVDGSFHDPLVAPIVVGELMDIGLSGVTEDVSKVDVSVEVNDAPKGVDEIVRWVLSGDVHEEVDLFMAVRSSSGGVARLHAPGSTLWSHIDGANLTEMTSTGPLDWLETLLRFVGLLEGPGNPAAI